MADAEPSQGASEAVVEAAPVEEEVKLRPVLKKSRSKKVINKTQLPPIPKRRGPLPETPSQPSAYQTFMISPRKDSIGNDNSSLDPESGMEFMSSTVDALVEAPRKLSSVLIPPNKIFLAELAAASGSSSSSSSSSSSNAKASPVKPARPARSPPPPHLDESPASPPPSSLSSSLSTSPVAPEVPKVPRRPGAHAKESVTPVASETGLKDGQNSSSDTLSDSEKSKQPQDQDENHPEHHDSATISGLEDQSPRDNDDDHEEHDEDDDDDDDDEEERERKVQKRASRAPTLPPKPKGLPKPQKPPQLPPKPPVSHFEAEEEVVASPAVPETEEETRARFRGLVIEEIISTEEAYVFDVQVIVNKFLRPLRSSQILTPEELGRLFSNIELVADANKEILSELMAIRGRDPMATMVGNIFSKRVEYFVQVYTHYCLNQTTAMTTYESVMKKHTKFKTFNDRMLHNPDCRQLDIVSFIVKPVQRLCKYPLLLRELMRYTPPDHIDFQNLTVALEKVNELVNLVNQSSREAANLQKILSIDASLNGAQHVKLMIPGRRYIRDGLLTKISGPRVQERHFFLFNDLLIYARPTLVKTKKERSYDFKGLIPLNLLMFRDLPDTDSLRNAIELFRIDLNKKYIVYSDEPSVKKEWLTVLEEQKNLLVSKAESSTSPRSRPSEAGDNIAFQMGNDELRKGQSLKIAELESKIVGFKSYAKKDRKFVKESVCTTVIDGTYRDDCYAFMFDDLILLTKRQDKDRIKKGFTIKAEIPLKKVVVVDLDDIFYPDSVENSRTNAVEFSINDGRDTKKHIVQFMTSLNKKEWIETIESTIQQRVAEAESFQVTNVVIAGTKLSTNMVPTAPILTSTSSTMTLVPLSELRSSNSSVNVHASPRSQSSGPASPTSPLPKTASLSNMIGFGSPLHESVSSPSLSRNSHKSCTKCNQPFHHLKRPKKTCRKCDQAFCSTCAPKKRVLSEKGTKMTRICDACFSAS